MNKLSAALLAFSLGTAISTCANAAAYDCVGYDPTHAKHAVVIDFDKSSIIVDNDTFPLLKPPAGQKSNVVAVSVPYDTDDYHMVYIVITGDKADANHYVISEMTSKTHEEKSSIDLQCKERSLIPPTKD